MKKLFTFLMLMVCAIGTAWADSQTIGLTQDYTETPTPTSSNKLWTSLSAETDHLTLTQQIGSKITNYGKGDKGDVICDGVPLASKNSYMGCWRTGDPGTSYDDQYIGFDLDISEGYALNISKINARALYISSSLTWKVQILNSSNVVLYESSELSISNKGTSPKVDLTVSSLATNEQEKLTNISGIVKVRLFVKGGKTKYFGIDQLTITAEVVTDARQTYTITTSANPAEGGIVSPVTGEQVEGSDVVLTATPNTGYKFIKWTVDGAVETANPYTITNITAAHVAEATFEALPKISFLPGDDEEVKGVAPTTDYAEAGTTYTIPTSYFLMKEGYTLTGWNDGSYTYKAGDVVTISGDMILTAVFEANTVSLGKNETTVTWPFAKKDGAPATKLEGNTGYYVMNAEVGEANIDVVMLIDTRDNAGMSGSRGKVDMQDDRAQVNKGTVFTIPAVKGMTVMLTYTNGGSTVSDISFADADADDIDTDAKTYTYTYNGSESSINIIVKIDNFYMSGISVTYPNATACAKPTITLGGFNFENKGYEVTVTAGKSSETLNVSTDGTNFSEQTSPYTTYITSETTFYAKDSSSGLSDSDVAELKVTPSESFDSSKPYVAWVYTKGYGAAEYAFETDPMVTALKSSYNVVEVNYAADVTPSADLNNADLIVCTEAMSGGKIMSNSMKNFAGVTPMIGLKAYNYTKGRWSWGAPANPNPTAQAFTPKSALYKVLDGVTYEEDGSIVLATATSGNVVQTVSFGTTDTTTPEGNVILGTIGDDDTKAVMYVSNKFFGLGLSSDCWSTYSDNALTIIRNAAKMLIAGEDLTATNPVEVAIGSTGYATFSSKLAVDFSDAAVTVYTAKVNGSKAELTEVESKKVPANTGVILKGSDTVTGAVIAEADALTDNDLIAATSDVTTTGIYILVPDGESVKFTTMTSGTLKAGKAYLPAASSARELNLVFGEATGISEMKNANTSAEVYDLNGMRVAQPTKGLYIQNGKKMIVK